MGAGVVLRKALKPPILHPNDAWAGLVAPAGTPAAVVQKLNTTLREIIGSPDVQARFKNVGFEGFSSTPEELGALSPKI